ncbi:MAG: phosphatase PAP2 family protein [Candidatus Cyclobacteriaceae bacterium M2_1C_046]
MTDFNKTAIIFFILINSFSVTAQESQQVKNPQDTVSTEVDLSSEEKEKIKTSELPEGNNRRFLRRGVAPSAALILAGIYTLEGRGFFSSHDLFDYRSRAFPEFSTNADDFLMWGPLVGLYGISLLSEEGRHGLKRQTLLLLASGILTSALVWPTKAWTGMERPDGDPHAFPSGHTAYAFTIATFMDKEFRDSKPWVSVVSYTIAGATGVLRVLNNKHWMSDVLAGAGVGILSVNTVYWLNGKLFNNDNLNTSLTPFILPTGQSGATLTLRF